MVCTVRSQRMAALARLLSNTETDDLANQRLALKNIQRELREADEPNLIDEKDMHVFDLRPMTDPLHLVCCNACMKPIKTSQFAKHAEICHSLASVQVIDLELDGATKGPKKPKPPRKDRKKLIAVNSHKISSIEGNKFEILDTAELSVPQSCAEIPIVEAKDCPAVVDGLGNGDRDPNSVGSAMPSSAKRSKIAKTEGPPPVLGQVEAPNAVTVISQGVLPCTGMEAPKSSTPEIQITASHLRKPQISRRRDELCLNKDVPAPLATKTYYSRENPLRSALRHMYYSTLTGEHPNPNAKEKVFQPNVNQTLATSSDNIPSAPDCS